MINAHPSLRRSLAQALSSSCPLDSLSHAAEGKEPKGQPECPSLIRKAPMPQPT